MNNKTKIRALMKQIESGQIKTDKVRILRYIIRNEMTSAPMIEDALNLSRQTVSARCSDLQDIGLIYVVNSDDVDYQVYRYEPDPYSQARRAYDRKKAKFDQWKKRGIREFGEFIDLAQLELRL